MIRNLKLYFSFLMASLKEMMEYRTDFIIGMISQVSYQIIELIFIWIVFQNTDSIAGWTFDHLLLLYGTIMLAISITDTCFDGTFSVGHRLMKKGKFDTLLLRPVHPLVSVLGETKTSTNLGYILLAIILIISTLIKLQIPITAFLIFKILYFGILGGIIIGGIQTTFSIAGFWTYKSNEVVWSIFKMHKLVEYPIDIYNKFIKILITFIFPFAFVSYYPTLSYLEGNHTSLFFIVPIIALIIWIIAIKSWNWALKKYRSTGN